ncbi:MAG: AEC family transporter, partial [Bauldia sp.]
MSQTLAIVLPVFGLIALGFALARTGLLKDQVGESLADFVFIVAIPVLIFRTLAEADFTGAAPWRIWLPFFATFGLMWILGDWLVRRLFGRDARAGLVAGISAAYGNTVLVGIPLALAAFGDAGAVPIALIIAIHLPVMMGASAILIERAERLDGVTEAPRSAAVMARSVLANLGRNPII